jgi:hypothetical protein
VAFSAFFEEELQLVDAAVTITAVENEAGYLPDEWSYSGSGDAYTILAGSEKAAQLGAAALMAALGFIFFKPGGTNPTYYPASITRGLSAVKQTYWITNIRFYRAYAGVWGQGYATEGNAWADAEERWQTLTGMGPETPTPVGHRWDGIIESTTVGSGMSMSNRGWFLANPQYCANPEAIGTSGFGNPTFQLDGSLSSEEYNILVDVVAATLLRDTSAINEFNRTHFDSEDGSTWDSATTFGFAKDVVDRCRAGTSGLGNHPARAGIPDLQLGVYAYASHRIPPPAGDYSGLYIQIAVGFSKAGYATYVDLVEAHAERYDFIGIRDYTCVQLWCGGFPMTSSIEKPGLLEVYDQYKAVGADGCNSENQWYPSFNLVGMTAMQRKLRTGVSDWAGAMDDVIEHVYDDDPAVRELYELFADPLQKWHIWNLKNIVTIVEAMADSWYKTQYKYCIVVWYELLSLPDQMTAAANPTDYKTENDPYYIHLPKMMKHIWAMRNLHMLDCFPLVRQYTNNAPATNYPEFKYDNKWINYDAKTANFTVGGTMPGVAGSTATIRMITDNGDGTGTLVIAGTPLTTADNAIITDSLGGSAMINGALYYCDWWMNPYLPTTEEYDETVAAINAASAREEDFDSQDLVLMHNVTPALTTTNGTGFTTTNNGPSYVVFVGPGTVTQTGTTTEYDDDGSPIGTIDVEEDIPCPAGVTRIEEPFGNFTWTHEGGNMFFDMFPQVWRGTSPGGDQYVWFPTRVNGTAEIIVASRVRIRNASGTYDLYPEDDDDFTVTAANLGPGQLVLDNGNTSGKATFSNVNKYLSLRGDVILAPRELIEEDYPALGKILKS